ncbi:hypothetical protein DRE_01317 [Drechslerella stenobrocha 248]|uniref:Impact N-terminal domain-containing protein n=1 Tax=Drechslerella stenobrocha 248 TaxID=1043628 RepID=W7I5G2_9PEZI|nr:hypothetical protein DRE_01317 [Drechslerella stenobrocha 248]
MPPKRQLSTTDLAASPLYVSKPIHDRASTFTAYFSPTAPQRQLQAHADLTTATHRILAWRKQSAAQKTLTGLPTYHTGFDDDGEAYAGRRLLKLLDDYKVAGAIVVARWYGGTMLGPVRFQHVENAAREAIRAYLADKDGELKVTAGEEGGELVKRAKVSSEQEAKEEVGSEKEALVKELRERDESIVVLRALLDEKLVRVREKEQAPSHDQDAERKQQADGGASKPPVKVIDYESMLLERLRFIDKARDNTIAFLLKKIDEMEAKLETMRDIKPSSLSVSNDSSPQKLDNSTSSSET